VQSELADGIGEARDVGEQLSLQLLQLREAREAQ
jgi:hypothetical protein